MNERPGQRSDRERRARILAMRAKGMTQREVGAQFGVTRMRIAQIEFSSLQTDERIAARLRFPDLLPELALRLARRFSNDAAVRAATNEELLSMRGMGPARLAKLRERFPHREETAMRPSGGEPRSDSSEG